MIVKELLEILQGVNPTTQIVIARESHAMGSSQTGMYEIDILRTIKEAKFMEADTLAGLDELEKVNRIELMEE